MYGLEEDKFGQFEVMRRGVGIADEESTRSRDGPASE